MNSIYFIRHSKVEMDPNDRLRPLSTMGIKDIERLNYYLEDKRIDRIYSSPYKRAIDTITPFAIKQGLDIHIEENLKERKVSDHWIDDFDTFAVKQWEDVDYQIEGGESLKEVEKRAVNIVNRIISQHTNENIIIATHGTWLSVVCHHYDVNYDYSFFNDIKNNMPYVVRMDFDGLNCVHIQPMDIFKYPLLNQVFDVTMDRPLGTKHPKFDMIYPINYGYVNGIMGGDGQEQDVYLLEVDKPVLSYRGKVVAIVHRLNDIEDKWVMIPENETISLDKIKESIAFQEQYFKSIIFY